MKRILLTLLVIMTVSLSFAQQIIKGKVTDIQGEPLIGASVRAIGYTQGAITDFDGNYTLVSDAKEVEITYLGYKTLKVKVVKGRADACMEENSDVLDEVVVIGYGSVKKGNVTNAVAQLKGEDIAERPVTNVASALQGELAGVEVQSTSGAPGSAVTIKVRGATSINEDGSSDPLFVVDGVPMDEDFDLSQINPQDIASIEVLKDASSSAIYGSRGANGVVLITSKTGGTEDGKTDIRFSANFALSTPERYMPVMSANEWISMRSASNNYNYVNSNANRGALASDSYAMRIAIGGGAGTSSVNDPRWTMPGYGGLNIIDWQKALFHNGFTQNYNLSISHGNRKNNYRASAAYVNQGGIVKNTGFQRLNLRLNGLTTLFDKIELGIDITPQMTVTTGGNVDGKDNAAQGALTAVPVTENAAGLYTNTDPYYRYLWAGNAASPYALMEKRTYRDENIRINSSAFIRYHINPGLKAEVLGSWIFNNRDLHIFTPSSVINKWSSAAEGYYATGRYINSRSHKYLLQATVTYAHTFAKKHDLNVIAGWSIESTQDAYTYEQQNSNYPNNIIQGWETSSVTVTKNDFKYITDDRMVSYFARVGYGYDNRYLINISVRRDGSSRFGTNRKWGTFPAVSAAWRISDEHFWNPSWLWNQAKFRVSYGSNGSNSIPLNAADGMLGTSYYSAGGAVITGYIPTSTSNPDLGWQKTNSWNFGIDLSFLHNRISLAADYYVKNIKDMLYQVNLPTVIGYSKGWSNIGNIRTKGVELEFSSVNIAGPFEWKTKLSVGYSTNEVTDLGQNKQIFCGYDDQTQIVEVGHPVGEYYMYIADGIYQTAEDLARYPKEATSEIGTVRYRDVNGDGIITEADRTYVGKPQPDWTLGMTNSFHWGNWDASFLITSQLGGKIWSALGRAIEYQAGGVDHNLLRRMGNMWISEENPGDGLVPRANGGSYERYSTRWLYSTDFIKLKNITVGYRWRLPKKFNLQVIRFTASIENLIMFDGYKNGFSPETNNNGSNQLRAYDYGAYPLARTFSIGVNLQF